MRDPEQSRACAPLPQCSLAAVTFRELCTNDACGLLVLLSSESHTLYVLDDDENVLLQPPTAAPSTLWKLLQAQQ